MVEPPNVTESVRNELRVNTNSGRVLAHRLAHFRKLCIVCVYYGLVGQVALMISCYVVVFVDFGICAHSMFFSQLIMLVFEDLYFSQRVDESPLVDWPVFVRLCLSHRVGY